MGLITSDDMPFTPGVLSELKILKMFTFQRIEIVQQEIEDLEQYAIKCI